MPTALSYHASRWFGEQKDSISQIRHVVGDRIEEALADDVRDLLASSFRPVADEKLLLTTSGRPRYVFIGVKGAAVSRRLLRRACERLWPLDAPTPEVYRKAAYLLLQDQRCTIRPSPFTGLIASRD